MKRILSLILVLVIAFSLYIPVSASSSSDVVTLTVEQMIALLAGSEFTYSYQVWNEDNTELLPVQFGSVNPVIYEMSPDFPGNLIYDSSIVLFLPIPGLIGNNIYSFSCSFNLPITIESCNYVNTGVAATTILSTNTTDNIYCFEKSQDMEYYLYDSDHRIVFNNSYYAPEIKDNFVSTVFKLSNGDFFRGNWGRSNSSSYTFYRATGTIGNPLFNADFITLVGNNRDVSSFSFVWRANAYATQTGSDNVSLGLGFVIQNFTISSNIEGGYQPGGGSSGGGGSGGGSGIDYTQKLDDLYNQLLQNGQIQSDINDNITGFRQDIMNPSSSQVSQASAQNSVLSSASDLISSIGSEIDITLSPEQSNDISSQFAFVQGVGDEVSSAIADPGSPLALISACFNSGTKTFSGFGFIVWAILLCMTLALISIILYGFKAKGG